MRRGPLRDTLDDDLSTITISPFVAYIALALERVWLGMRSGTSILFEASLFEASPPPITLTMYNDRSAYDHARDQ